MGEHAVLHGHHAIVCAVDKFINVILTPNDTEFITIYSDKLGDYQTKIDNINIEKPFQFILASVKRYQRLIKNGFELNIKSDFSHKIGFGSSAAVTVATLATLAKAFNTSLLPMQLFIQARDIIQRVQGCGSGADVAASVFGGTLLYSLNDESQIQKLQNNPQLTVAYSGSKTPTPEVIKHVNQTYENFPSVIETIYQAIGYGALQGANLINQANWQKLGQLFTIQNGLMEALTVNTPELEKLTILLNQKSKISGAKISGSGLGDCVVGLGKLTDKEALLLEKQTTLLPVTISEKGVCFE